MKTEKKLVGVLLTPEIIERMRCESARRDVSHSHLVREALDRALPKDIHMEIVVGRESRRAKSA